jgi:hypothetical protein
VTDTTLVGVLGGGRGATVGPRGEVRPERAGWRLDWWIGADDRWHVAEDEVAVRQTRLEAMPIVQTSMRVPGGDAVQRVYGVSASEGGAVAVLEIANESPAPFVAALVVTGARAIDLHGTTVVVDGRPALRAPRPPSRWAVSVDGRTREIVTTGGASDAPFSPRADRGGGLVAAFLHPVAHRTALRIAVALGTGSVGAVEVGHLAAADEVARGWRAQLDRGMRVEVPDPVLQSAVDAARAALLLEGQAWRADPRVVAALEDWGFDAETADAWSRLTGRERRRLARRVPTPATWADVHARVEGLRSAPNHADFLAALRNVLVREAGEAVNLLDDWPSPWRGLPLDVRDAPTREGPVSCSVRWHGDRPALLWDAPPGVRLRVAGLDPAWSTTVARGEVLLGASPVEDARGQDLAGA